MVSSEKKLKQLIQQAQKDGYEYLTCRIIIKKISDIHMLEKHGFYITDIGCTWEVKLSSRFQVPSSKFRGRKATLKDAAMLKSIVKGLFKESRFYNDPFFTKRESDRLYQTWIDNLLKDKMVKTLLADKSGFIVCKKISRHRGDIPLVGVISEEQNKGIGRCLMAAGLQWFKNMGIKRVAVRTQANNISAMNFYNEMGFMVKHIDATMGFILQQGKI